MKIDEIIVATHRGDYWLTRICVASIRKWYPDIPIRLLKDELNGEFDTSEIENAWDVGVLEVPRRLFGWGVSKFEPYFLPYRKRVLIMDSDIVFAGPVLERLERCDEDFVVSPEFPEHPHGEWFETTYYRIDEVRKSVDPLFEYPGYVFNTGQIVCHTGILSRETFAPFVDYDCEVPALRHNHALSCADQGILNHLLPALQKRGKVSVALDRFQIWSKHDEAAEMDLVRIRTGGGYPLMIHWAGDHAEFIGLLSRADILLYYQKEYYKRLPFGSCRRWMFNAGRNWNYHKNRLWRAFWTEVWQQRVKPLLQGAG